MKKNKTAIITGSANGIGLYFAKTLAKKNFNLILLDIDKDLVNNSKEIVSKAAIKTINIDITDEIKVEKAILETANEFNSIEVLINNAGLIFDLRKPIENITLKEWKQSIDVNLTGTFLLCKHVIPHMKKNNFGRIINISSALTNTGAFGRAHYISSKAGVIGLTRSLAKEVGEHNITVNSIAPGLVDSGQRARNFVHKSIFEFEKQRRTISKKMFPKDLKDSLLYLISKNNNFTTGQTLFIDGGVTFN